MSVTRRRKSPEDLRKRAVAMGARKARVISASSVKTAAWVRYKCQFGCSGFGQCFTCPPRSPAPHETQKIIDGYKKAILIQVTDREHTGVSEIARKLEREAFLAGYHKAFALGAGPCMLCRECDFEGGCRHPEEARPAMEACGIDVFSTARANGMLIDTLETTRDKAHYYGLVLLE